MTAAIGQLSKIGIDTASPVTVRQDFQSSGLDIDETFVDGNGLRGTLSPDISRVRTGSYRLHGGLSMQPNVLEMQQMLPWILGTDVSGTTYALADTAKTRYVALEFNTTTDLWTSTSVAVMSATFHAEQFSSLNLDMDLLGLTTASSGSFPAINIDVATNQWVFTDLAVTIGGTTIAPKNFTMTVNNGLDADWFLNSLTLSAIVKLNRVITVGFDLSYGDYSAKFASGGSSGVAVVATFTNGVKVLTFSLAKVAAPRRPRTIARGENMFRWEGQAYWYGTTRELVTTLAVS